MPVPGVSTIAREASVIGDVCAVVVEMTAFYSGVWDLGN